jgi:hypothetical protein
MKDDLESLAYTIVFLVRGDLPWSIWTDQSLDLILSKKLMTSSDELTANLPGNLYSLPLHLVKNLIEYYSLSKKSH